MFHQGGAELMVDTGSDLNLIKEDSVDPRAWIDRNKKYHITGIGSGMYETLGEIKVFIKAVETYFHIVPETFPIKQQGILGMQFLKENGAILNLKNGQLIFDNDSLPLLEYHTIHLPARTKKLIKIPISDASAKSGYLARIQAGPGVFLGECLATHKSDHAKVFAINSNPHDIVLTLAPVELEPCHVITPRASVPTPQSKHRKWWPSVSVGSSRL